MSPMERSDAWQHYQVGAPARVSIVWLRVERQAGANHQGRKHDATVALHALRSPVAS